MKFNENLIYYRKKNGFSQEELAERLNVTRQTISKWELEATVPDLDKLLELSEIFHISLDELTGSNFGNTARKTKTGYSYEYVSKRKLFGIPLIHVNLGFGIRRAKGILAIGNIATGVIAIGGIAIGCISFGALGIGLLCLAAACLGVFSIGGFAAGILAVGGIALGVYAIGGVAVGIYSIGGVAVAKKIAYGGVAIGNIAIGDATRGNYIFRVNSHLPQVSKSELRQTILSCYPKIWSFILNIFCSLV